MMSKLFSKNILYQIIICVMIWGLFYFLIDPNFLLGKTVFYNFQMRDLYRAREILNGNLILYGPELTGGGNTPGSLYYVVLALGLLIKNTWMSSWIILIIFTFFCTLLGKNYFKKDPLLSIIWVILITTAPFTSWFIKAFLNVSYLIPFSVIAIILYFKTFELNKINQKFLYLAFLNIGIGIQFHFSLICFLIPMLGYLILLKKKDSNIINSKKIIIAIALFILPILPHIIWLICNRMGISFGKAAFYSGKTEQSLPSMLYLINLTLASLKGKFIYSSLNKIFFTFPYLTHPVLLTLLFNYKKIQFSNSSKYFLIVLGAFIPYFSWYISSQAHRYSIPFYTLSVFLTILGLRKILKEHQLIKHLEFFSLLTVLAIFIFEFFDNGNLNYWSLLFSISKVFIITLIISLAMLKMLNALTRLTFIVISTALLLACLQKEFVNNDRFFNSKNQEGYMMSYNEWRNLFQNTIGKTGWSIEEFLDKTYFIGHHVNQSPKLAYEEIKDQIIIDQNHLIKPDGFIISNRFGVNSMRKRKKRNASDWILKQNIHKSLEDSLLNNEIELGENISDSVLILPFYSRANTYLPIHFQNNSLGYLPSKESDILIGYPKEKASLLSDNSILFKWNNCEDQNNYCSNGAIVNISHNNIKVRIIGYTLSQITPWISPNWTESWQFPFIEVKCGKQNFKKTLIESIGFQRKYSHQAERTPFFAGNNSISAPISLDLNFPCKERINQISIGRESSVIDKIVSTQIIIVPTISYNLTPQ